MQNVGFTILPIPGNHDYSDALDAETLSPALELISDFLPVGFLDLWDALVELRARDEGYRKDCLTGINIDFGAVNRFRSWQRAHFFANWTEGCAYHYHESYLKPQKSLHCLLVDSQDLDVNEPWWALGGIIANNGLFMGDESLRYARGFVSHTQLGEINELIRNLYPSEKFMLSAHNWINYFVSISMPSAEQQLVMIILGLYRQFGADGSHVPDGGLEGNSLRAKLFKLLLRLAILPKEELKQFTDAVATKYGGYGAFDYDSYSYLYGQAEFSNQRLSNPKLKDYDHDLHKIRNEEDLFSILDHCNIFLVGHRHKYWFWEDLRIALRAQLDHINNSITPYIILRSQLEKSEIIEFLHEIGFFMANYYDSNINGIKIELIELLAEKVMQSDLSYNVNAKYQELVEKELDYYCESHCSNKEGNLGWLEICLDLRTSEVTIEKRGISNS